MTTWLRGSPQPRPRGVFHPRSAVIAGGAAERPGENNGAARPGPLPGTMAQRSLSSSPPESPRGRAGRGARGCATKALPLPEGPPLPAGTERPRQPRGSDIPRGSVRCCLEGTGGARPSPPAASLCPSARCGALSAGGSPAGAARGQAEARGPGAQLPGGGCRPRPPPAPRSPWGERPGFASTASATPAPSPATPPGPLEGLPTIRPRAVPSPAPGGGGPPPPRGGAAAAPGAALGPDPSTQPPPAPRGCAGPQEGATSPGAPGAGGGGTAGTPPSLRSSLPPGAGAAAPRPLAGPVRGQAGPCPRQAPPWAVRDKTWGTSPAVPRQAALRPLGTGQRFGGTAPPAPSRNF